MSQTLKTHNLNNQEKGKEAEKPGTDENLSRPSAEPKLLDQLTETAERCGHTVEAAKGMADWCRRFSSFPSSAWERRLGSSPSSYGIMNDNASRACIEAFPSGAWE